MTGAESGDRRRGGDAVFLVVVLTAGVALRLLWLARTPAGLTGFVGGGEAARIALALARDGRFGDAFWDGSGPTAHLMPVMPAIAAFVFRLFPPASAAAAVTLLAWALAQTIGGILLLRALFARLGADPRALRWTVAALALLPVYAPEETIGFRYWDGALVVCLSSANLLAALAVERRSALSLPAATGAATLWAATMFTSPVAGLALALVWGWVALRRLPLIQAARFALLSGLAIAALVTPWTLRNARELGTPILLRSNFGLELAIGYDPAALTDKPPEQAYFDRLVAIHPLYGASGRSALLRAGGEVPYFQSLGAGVRDWARAHPLAFARLTVRHVVQFFFPPAWLLLPSTWEEWMPARAALISLLDLGGIIAIFVGVRRRRPGYALLAIFVAAAAAPYAIVQPGPRYTYLVYGLLAFAALDGVARIGTKRPGAAKPR